MKKKNDGNIQDLLKRTSVLYSVKGVDLFDGLPYLVNQRTFTVLMIWSLNSSQQS